MQSIELLAMITSYLTEVKIMDHFEEITCDELGEYTAKPATILVDVRNKDEVLNGIIAGAIHIPLEAIPNQYHLLEEKDNIIFYCHSGIRSAHAAAFMLNQTNTQANVYNLIGGVVAWRKAGNPFVSGQ